MPLRLVDCPAARLMMFAVTSVAILIAYHL